MVDKERFVRCLAAATGTAIVLVVLLLAGFWHDTQARAADIFYAERQTLQNITVMAIDDASLQAVGRWPWPRNTTAALIAKASGAAVVGVDVAFLEPAQGDAALQAAVKNAKAVLVAEYDKDVLMNPVVNATFGHASVERDSNGIARAVQQRSIPGFAEQVASRLGASASSNLRPSFSRNIKVVSAKDVLGRNESFAGQIVLIGATAPDLHDELLTPVGLMPGVVFQANTVASILDDELVWPAPLWATVLLVLFACLLSGVFLGVAGFKWGSVLLGAIIAGIAASGALLAERQIILNAFFAFLAVPGTLTAAGITNYALEKRKRRVVTELFGRYVSPEIAAELIKDPANSAGKKCEITVMFTDIRGYTALSEKHPAETIVQLLNTYLGRLTQVIMDNHGVVDKYIGDAIMAVWNAPVGCGEHVLHASKAALAMQQAIAELNKQAELPVHLGIGLHTGEAIIGSIGIPERMEYTVIGDAVNLASRLCSKAERGEIRVSQEVVDALGGRAVVNDLGKHEVKNKAAPVQMYALVGIKT
ncbi:adenylate/guanylate cyclase domain-containing protein [Candidatus Woesearchaeota archaeon]|nr:adenylate/guanylate cyclase domain-containing protein [Candidatus Woesearchaeota archaeon]